MRSCSRRRSRQVSGRTAAFEFYERAPRLLLPVFGVAAARRARHEIRAALPEWRERLRFSVGHGARVLMAPVSPRLMVRRIRLLSTVDFREDVKRVTAPTLLVTGDPGLDRTVPVEHTREYLESAAVRRGRDPRSHRPPGHRHQARGVRAPGARLRGADERRAPGAPPRRVAG